MQTRFAATNERKMDAITRKAVELQENSEAPAGDAAAGSGGAAAEVATSPRPLTRDDSEMSSKPALHRRQTLWWPWQFLTLAPSVASERPLRMPTIQHGLSAMLRHSKLRPVARSARVRRQTTALEWIGMPMT